MKYGKHVYRVFFIFLCSILIVPCTQNITYGKNSASKKHVIIIFKNNIEKNTITQLDGKVKHSFHSISAIAGEVPQSAISKLQANDQIAKIEPDQKVRVSGQIRDWGVSKVQAPRAWSSHFTGKGVKIAVLDTGIAKHPDLSIAGGVSMVSKSYNDTDGHGTHVAGIIAAKNNKIGVVGVAPDAQIYAVKVLKSDGDGYISDVISGIEWSIKHHMNIINMSFGTLDYSEALKKEVDKASRNGILVVAAAGNHSNSKTSSKTDNIDYPARLSSTVAVGGVGKNLKKASFSSIGKEIEFTAPAVDILSTYIGNQYAWMDGTSMATPFVTGALALLKQEYPHLSNQALIAKLYTSTIDLGAKGKDHYYGYGFVQAPYIKSSFSTSLKTNQSTYKRGNTVQITENVLNANSKKPVSDANVKIVITTIKGVVKNTTTKTNSKGTITYKLTTNSHFYKGQYLITTTVSKSGYNTKIASKTIVLN
ncbi:S8 family peptidase [Bacillus ginsengihumi]|uniref:S8 family peptidase n=1 Tax=Heyndrickxia ginsengihumi TaxID=363870 RepID=A0A6M0P550_9BACI|nr:S8 family peptidase [Heyndrickxia ginsengihumi]MCM3022625.1 S8 family serine peptidase [Heyndrickxia ginsengihumi]NEY19040.1 S8 family peptidase [Heyndrickxia ginsengihumi]